MKKQKGQNPDNYGGHGDAQYDKAKIEDNLAEIYRVPHNIEDIFPYNTLGFADLTEYNGESSFREDAG